MSSVCVGVWVFRQHSFNAVIEAQAGSIRFLNGAERECINFECDANIQSWVVL